MQLDELTRALHDTADGLPASDPTRGRRAVATKVKRRRLIDGSVLVAALMVVVAVAVSLAVRQPDGDGYLGSEGVPRLVPGNVPGTRPWTFLSLPVDGASASTERLWVWTKDDPLAVGDTAGVAIVVRMPDPAVLSGSAATTPPMAPELQRTAGGGTALTTSFGPGQRGVEGVVGRGYGEDVLRSLHDGTRVDPDGHVSLPPVPPGLRPVVQDRPIGFATFTPNVLTSADSGQALALVTTENHTEERVGIQVGVAARGDVAALAWLLGVQLGPAEPARWRGHDGWRIGPAVPFPAGSSSGPGAEPSNQGVVFWEERPGVFVSVAAEGSEAASLDAVVAGLHEPTDEEWARWTQLERLATATCPSAQAEPEECTSQPGAPGTTADPQRPPRPATGG